MMFITNVTDKKENALSRYPNMYKATFEGENNKPLFEYFLVKKEPFGEWFLNSKVHNVLQNLNTTSFDNAINLSIDVAKKLVLSMTQDKFVENIKKQLDDDNVIYKPTPDVKAEVIIHSISEKEFEVMDITFYDERQEKLSKEFEKLQSQGLPIPNGLVGDLCKIDAIQEMASEDLGDYGEESSYINKELWKKFGQEMFHTLMVEISYTDSKDYLTGEVDTDASCEYELIKSSLGYEDYDYENEPSVLDEIDDI